jgi:hypothetical protein
MKMKYMPGSIVSILDGDFNIAGDVKVDMYLHNEQLYTVVWTYQQTGESEVLKVPEWRLVEKSTQRIFQ